MASAPEPNISPPSCAEGTTTVTTPMTNSKGGGAGAEGNTPMSNSKGRKRVRFDEAPPAVRERSPDGEEDAGEIVETISLDIDEVCATKKRRGADAVRTRLPGEDEDDLDETCFQRADIGAIKDFDPAVAAKRRAALREEQKRRNAMMDVSIVPADIAEAEEEYNDDDEDHERYITGDIPIEPFNLKHERETGYFDAFGNYIEYRLDADARDAWLDSLSDTKLSRKPQATSSSLVSEVEQELDKEDIALYKRRMMALLEPGENAFAALRRLGARPTPPPPKQKHQPQETLGTTAARQRQRKQQREQQQQQQQQQQQHATPLQGPMNGAMDAQGPAASASSEAPSVAPSSTSVSLASASGVPSSLSEAPSSSSVATIAPAETSTRAAHAGCSADQTARPSAPAASASTSTQATAEGSSLGAASAGEKSSREKGRSSSGTNGSIGGMRGPAMENSAEFDKLTEYADLLLGYGELGIYTKTKEQLAKELAGPGSSVQQQQQGHQRQGTEEGGDGSRLVEALLSAATPAEQQTEGAGQGGGAAASVVPEGMRPPEEDDRDMFGESFDAKESKDHPGPIQASAAAPTSAAAAPDARAEQTTGEAIPDATSARDHSIAEAEPESGAGEAQPQAPADQELLQQLDGLEAQPAAAATPASQQQQQSAQDDGTSSAQDTVQQQQQHWMVNGGFELDPGSGMFYSSNLGLWYNSQTALYMDAQTGAWYRVNNTGSYEAAPEAGQGFGCQEEGVQV